MLRVDAPPGARRFRILARVSDDKLRSLPQQVADCEAYVGSLGGGAAVDGLYNVGEWSGFSMSESPIYRQMLDDAKAGAFHALVVRDTSRLGRDYWEKLGTLRDLRAAKVEFHVVEDGGRFDFDDRLSKVKSWASTWADDEKKREEVRKSKRATASRREMGFPTVRPPFGYRVARDKALGRKVWRPEPAEARVVVAVFEGFAAGRPIAELQREHGLQYYQVDRILSNPAYTGGFTWDGKFQKCAPEVVPPLVREDAFAAVQAARDTRPASPSDERPA